MLGSGEHFKINNAISLYDLWLLYILCLKSMLKLKKYVNFTLFTQKISPLGLRGHKFNNFMSPYLLNLVKTGPVVVEEMLMHSRRQFIAIGHLTQVILKKVSADKQLNGHCQIDGNVALYLSFASKGLLFLLELPFSNSFSTFHQKIIKFPITW